MQRVEIGRPNPRMPMPPDRRVALIVGDDQDDVGPNRLVAAERLRPQAEYNRNNGQSLKSSNHRIRIHLTKHLIQRYQVFVQPLTTD